MKGFDDAPFRGMPIGILPSSVQFETGGFYAGCNWRKAGK